MSGGGREVEAKRGETLDSIAAREGIPVERILAHPKNAKLKARASGAQLFPGEAVFLPALEPKEVRGRTGQVTALTVDVPRVTLRLRLLVDGDPVDGASCAIAELKEEPRKTDRDGKLELTLPAHLTQLTLQADLPARKRKKADGTEGTEDELPARTRKLSFRVGHLANEVALLQARLTNLGFHCDPVDGATGPGGTLPPRTRRAYLRYRKAFGLDRDDDPKRPPTLETLEQLAAKDGRALDRLRHLHEQEEDWRRRFTDEDKLCRAAAPKYHVLTGPRWNRVNVLEGPEVIIDAHMHVMSGKCSPQPLTWDKNLVLTYLRPSRDQIDNGVVPLLGKGAQVARDLRVTSDTVAKQLSGLAHQRIELTRDELITLNAVLAQTLVLVGYVETELTKRNVSAAADGAAGLLDAAAQDARRNAAVARAVSSQMGAVEQRLRSMVPDQAAPSVELAGHATSIPGRIIEAVARAYVKVEEAKAEVGRQLANGVTEAAADVAGLGKEAAGGFSDLSTALGAIARAAAASMKPLAGQVNRSLDLVEADARGLVEFTAREIAARIDRGAAGATRAADVYIATNKAVAQAGFTAAEAQLRQLHDFTAISGMETQAIAAKAVAANDAVGQAIPRATGVELLSMMMAMPMDMDFAHLEGYEGKQIYQKVATRKLLELVLKPSAHGAPAVVLERRPLPPESTFDPRSLPSLIPQPNPVSVELRVTEEEGPFYYFHQVRHDIPIRELVWLPKKEFSQYQAYPKQTEHTLAAAAATPWSVLPLFHYDPRRWSQPSGTAKRTETFAGESRETFPQAWDEPFKQYFRKGSMRFAGIKLYTALGYRPWEPGGAKSRLPHQQDFYDHCTRERLPIVCHCSPGGMYSFDRPFFAKAEAERRGVPVKELRRETERLMEQRGVKVDWEEYWFSEHYVSPRAWREVLQKYGKLRLCLAHFGGDLPEFSNWARKEGASSDGWDEELFRLTGEFENVYVDISYFVFDDRKVARLAKALADHPHLRDKILFGTDWWMIEMSGLDYQKYVERARQALDGIDPELWQRFSRINPVRFYRLKENAEALAEGLRAGGPSDPEAAKEHKKAVNRGLAVLQSLEPGGERAK